MSAVEMIVLQKSKVAPVQIFGENHKRKEVDDSHSLSRATEVAHEFGVRRCGPSNSYTNNAPAALRNLTTSAKRLLQHYRDQSGHRAAATGGPFVDPKRKSRLLPNGPQSCRENPFTLGAGHLEKTPKQFSVLQQTFHYPPDRVCKILRPIEVEAMATWDDHNLG